MIGMDRMDRHQSNSKHATSKAKRGRGKAAKSTKTKVAKANPLFVHGLVAWLSQNISKQLNRKHATL